MNLRFPVLADASNSLFACEESGAAAAAAANRLIELSVNLGVRDSDTILTTTLPLLITLVRSFLPNILNVS